MSDSQPDLSPGAQALATFALNLQKKHNHPQLGTHHWLIALLERHDAMANTLSPGMNVPTLIPQLRAALSRGEIGEPLDEATLRQAALARAQARGKTQASERDVAASILTHAGYTVVANETTGTATPPRVASTPLTSTNSDYRDNAPRQDSTWQPIAKRPTPTLEKFSRDLTQAAVEGKLSPIIGRETEITVAIETLCRKTKRNPAFIGPAGVGKSAIVEGMAQQIVKGTVPQILHGTRIFATHASLLTAGAGVVGVLQERMQKIIAEASQEGIILFIDEVHSIIGAGGMPGTSDLASLLKPALARGEIACMVATTDEEYRRYIEPDTALERRFQAIRVQELTPEQTLAVLHILRDEYAAKRKVQVPDAVLAWQVDFAERFMRHRYFPDKAVDLLEQVVAYAITQNKTQVEIAEAEFVAQRMVGMPINLNERIGRLEKELATQALLIEPDLLAFVNRLRVTERSLDFQPARPNVVILMIGNATQNTERLTATIAECLYGNAERIVKIDFSRMTRPENVTLLIGSPPAYVGYGDTLAIHAVSQTPWCVLCCENVHLAHPSILAVLTQALRAGFLTDARGKRIYLSDTVVVMTAPFEMELQRQIGFVKTGTDIGGEAFQTLVNYLGEELLARCDLICARLPSQEPDARQLQELLADFAARYRKQGIALQWNDQVLETLADASRQADWHGWEYFFDNQLSPLLIPYLPSAGEEEVTLILTSTEDQRIQIASPS